MYEQFIIDVCVPLSNEEKEYIFDCWVEFISQDMGYKPCELFIYLKKAPILKRAFACLLSALKHTFRGSQSISN